jgi:hypothetical protein
MITEIHLTPKRAITRKQTDTRAFPLNEPNTPKGDGTPTSIHKIIEFLAVEKSERYRPTSTATYCNIYAYDYCCLMGAYLPRVFWTAEAIRTLNFTPAYGKTLTEMNANALYDWFRVRGGQFKWKEVNITEGQRLANQGKCVIMVAANKNRSKSGHIVALVPETQTVKSVGTGGIIIYPVMSQAGRVNKRYFNSKWWNGHEPIKIYVSE